MQAASSQQPVPVCPAATAATACTACTAYIACTACTAATACTACTVAVNVNILWPATCSLLPILPVLPALLLLHVLQLSDGQPLASNLFLTSMKITNKDIFSAILYADLDFIRPPWDSISPLARDLVQALLQRDPGGWWWRGRPSRHLPTLHPCPTPSLPPSFTEPTPFVPSLTKPS